MSKRINPGPKLRDIEDLGLSRAIRAAGSQGALARLIGLSPSVVSRWKRIPAHQLVAVERASGVPREMLRPELYRGKNDD